MKKSTIITIVAFVLGIIVLAAGFVLLTDNNISKSIREKKTTTTTKPTTTTAPNNYAYPAPDYKIIDFFQEDVTQWITLGQCKDLVVEVDKVNITEEDIDSRIHLILCQKDLHSKQLTGTTEEKVVFSFDYTGYLLEEDGTRGKAFDGGSNKNQLAYIDGNNLITLSTSSSELGSFIDGFAQGMLGMSVGETKTLDITFPKDYHSADMAGKKVEFDVTINFIAQTNFDDDTASHISNKKYTTVDAYRENLRKELEESLKNQNDQVVLLEILNNVTVVASSEKQYEYMFAILCEQVDYYVDYYAQFGYKMTFGEMLKQLTGYNSIDELEKYTQELIASEDAQLIIKQNILPYAIIASEQIEMTEEDYNAKLEELCEEQKKTAEELYEAYTEEFIRAFLKEIVLMEKAEKCLEDMIDTCVCVEKSN